MNARRRRFVLWPRSLQGQLLQAIALALLVGQAVSATLVWRAQHERGEAALVNTAAFRLLGGVGRSPERMPRPPERSRGRSPHALRLRVELSVPRAQGDKPMPDAQAALRDIFQSQGFNGRDVMMIERDPMHDPVALAWLRRHRPRQVEHQAQQGGPPMPRLIVAALHRPDGTWLSTRIVAPRVERGIFATFLLQTLFLYVVLVGAVALILRRIARPLAALTVRVEEFARARNADGQLEPSGPEDIRRLITAHNGMEARIAALLDEKDVMLGAIGHDLKTPLAALRVRIEAVEDDTERARMAATIEDLNRSLDDILSLARVGRPSDPIEPVELGALTAAVVDEFEDMGEPVELGDTARIVLPLRTTWVRRALRNIISNAVRYGACARVSLGREDGAAVLKIEDDGPGIPEGDIDRMLEPFTRLEPSRNTGTGGSGLGLTLARAIAEQHGGSLSLANRRGADGSVAGLVVTLRLPLA
ncbi:ATP-binding protein [Novosphingobium sp. ZN18A2]|uniref:sensor histidine kinase n=1 Tax=Novosphingobium sp. ZN18A2 TaxID=3079861 RepID=UPI0030CFCF14